jgi:hypothetical protein
MKPSKTFPVLTTYTAAPVSGILEELCGAKKLFIFVLQSSIENTSKIRGSPRRAMERRFRLSKNFVS